MCNLSVQNFLFPMHDAMLSQDHRKFQDEDLELVFLDYKASHDSLVDFPSHFSCDFSHQLHVLDRIE
jgi:hypothetical protein